VPKTRSIRSAVSIEHRLVTDTDTDTDPWLVFMKGVMPPYSGIQGAGVCEASPQKLEY